MPDFTTVGARRLAAAGCRDPDAKLLFRSAASENVSALARQELPTIEPNLSQGRARRLCFASWVYSP